MLPIGDENHPDQTVPLITWLLIALNLVVYFLLQGGTGHNPFTYAYSVVPYEITHLTDITGSVEIGRNSISLFAGPSPIWLTIFSAMFMHGSLGHLFGNLLYLWIFGDNVEHNMGKIKFLIFYVLCGVIATFAQIFVDPNSYIPNLGASGAIAGVLGAYLLLFPKNRIRVLAFYQIIPLPALIVIGLWGVTQVFMGFGSLGIAGKTGGVAYMAHAGGIIAGFILCFVFRNHELSLREQREKYRRDFSHFR